MSSSPLRYAAKKFSLLPDAHSDQLQPRFLIERYFVREDAIARPGEPSPTGLACAAATYFYDPTAGNFVFSAASNKADLESTSGALLLSRVDHFKVLLGVNSSTDAATSTATNSTRYMSIDDYIGLTEDAALGPAGKPRIVAVKVGVVTRSSGAGSATDTPTNFTVLGRRNSKLLIIVPLKRDTYMSLKFSIDRISPDQAVKLQPLKKCSLKETNAKFEFFVSPRP